jgi:hypothetical protein
LYFVKHYKTHACTSCPASELCTKNIKGRLIERSEYAPYIEKNRLNIAANPEIYKKRQAIIEHPYGTIKRQWGFNYIITKKGIKRASADVGFMFVAYNLRRLMNIIGICFKSPSKNWLFYFLNYWLPKGSNLQNARFHFSARARRNIFISRFKSHPIKLYLKTNGCS